MNRKIGLRIVFFFLMFILLFSSATDADISDSEISTGNIFTATTLDFTQNQTSNNSPISLLFNIAGLIPGGFDIEAVRIKKEGEMDFNYRFTAIQTAGDGNFCQSLTIMLVQNWVIKYEGTISNLLIDDHINENGIDDWIVLVKLESDNQTLAQKECQFDFVFKTWKTDPNETNGFYDEEILTNRVTSGNWANN
ncbi:hypothetical protein ACFL1Q_02000 [Patescibacteria group bacterium]